MSLLTFNPLSYEGLTFTNISVNETDSGTVASFADVPGSLVGLSTVIGPAIAWEGVNAGVYYANASEVLNLSYTVTAGSGSLLDEAGQIYTADSFSGPGIHLTAVENIYSTSGVLLATDTYTQGGSNQAYVPFSSAQQSVNVQITLTMSIDATGTSASTVLISAIQQQFNTVIAPPNTASIGDIVFYDSTGSGVESAFDAGPGVPGVTVELLNGNGTSILAVTTTNASGLYNFSGLAAGVYEVKFVSPTGYAFTQQGVGGNPAIDSSASQTTGITAPITLTAGQADHNVEAGLVASGGSAAGGTATLGNTVWLDTNHDGILDNGESGVAGVTVELLNGTGTSVLATTTTNSTGNYQFTNLTPGSYEVQFVAPGGDVFTTQNVPTTGIDSVANSSGQTVPVTLTAGEVDNNVNAGLVVPTCPYTLAASILSEFNAVIFTNASTSCDIEGATVVGGNFSGATLYTNPDGIALPATFGALTVYGSTSGSNINLNDGGSAYVGGSKGATINFNGGGGYIAAPDAGISSFSAPLDAVSLGLSQLAATGTLPATGNNEVITAIPGADGIAVIDLTAAQLAAIPSFKINLNGASTLVFNVNGTSANFNANDESGITGAGNIIWNFYNATGTVAFSTQVGGTVLAPLATVTNCNQIDGALVANAYSGSGELHEIPFVGALPVCNTAGLNGEVWLDGNSDGLLDNSEPGVSGVTVQLLNAAGTSVLATTTTSSSGAYSFLGLASSAYEVKVLKPSGDNFTTQGVAGGLDSLVSTSTGTTSPITLTAGQVVGNVDAGLVSAPTTGVITGTAFIDVNRDGLLDTGDTTVAGVTVYLVNGADTAFVGTPTTTNASGQYSFNGLAPGSYQVLIGTPSGDIFTTANVGGNPATESVFQPNSLSGVINLAAGQTSINNAGYLTAALTGEVWLDANSDGLLDNSEAGVAGVTVALLNAAGTSVLATTTTSSSGAYSFLGLSGGSYEVQVLKPSGDNFTTQGVAGGIDSLVSTGSGTTSPIALAAGQLVSNVDAGLVIAPTTGTITGTAFIDGNRNGVLGAGDTTVAGLTVYLVNGADTAFVGTPTTTNASGQYSFTGLAPGSYQVLIGIPSGDSFTTPDVGGNPATESVFQPNSLSGVINLAAGQTSIDNAGYLTAGLSGEVWLDGNSDGLLDNSEAGVAGVTVALLNAAGTSVLATTTTSSSGTYSFLGLTGGSYEVQVLKPSGDNFTAQGVSGGIDSLVNSGSGTTSPITVAAGQLVGNVDAGLVIAPTTGSITGTAFIDVNRDGVLDTGDTPLAGQTVYLVNGADTAFVGAPTTTNASGQYSFTGLAPGSYQVLIGTPSGDSFTTIDVGGNPATESVFQSNGLSGVINLAAGQTSIDNAGFLTPLGTVTGTVFQDVNRNGVYASPDTPVAGQTVYLVNSADTAILATTTTNSSGVYTFGNITPGSYQVLVVTPSGESVTTPGSGTNASTFLSNGLSGVFSVAGGQTVTENDGWVTPVAATCTISSYVFDDYNCDGISDDANNLLRGITVQLYNAAGTSVIATTTTNSGGEYIFSNIAAGTYEVGAKLPSGFMFITQRATTAGANINNTSAVNPSTGLTPAITVAAGQTVYNVNNIGIAQDNACISSYVYHDTNGDGVCDEANAFMGGVTVNLCNSSGQVLASCVTNSGGAYSFNNLCAGNYEIQCVLPNGYCFDPYHANPSNATATNCSNIINGSSYTPVISLSAGQTVNNVENIGLLNCASSPCGTSPVSTLQSCYGSPTCLEFIYNPGNSVSSGTNGSCSGSNSASSAYCVIENSNGSSIYYKGSISSGQDIFADASCGSTSNCNAIFSSTDGSNAIIAKIYASQAACQSGAAPIQTCSYGGVNTGSHFSDTVGSLKLVGYGGISGCQYT
jgi:choice-of-anchor A domain-containing protein